MNFVTPQFILFFLPVLALCWATRTRPALHLPLMLACNLAFYAFAGLRGLVVLLLTALVTWFCGFALACARGGRARRRWLWMGVGLCVGLLSVFKYSEFLLGGLGEALMGMGLALAGKALLECDIAYVSGISFFIFQAISYLADVWRGEMARPLGLSRVLLWLSFFPTVLSGPITRAGRFMEQFDHPTTDPALTSEGLLLILSGLFKKVVLSSYLSEHIVRQVFAAPESCSSLTVAMGVYGYSIQIFCDFSGYTDLALGIALLMGYRLPQNFDAPYLACNVQDFWRRWHITLSTWLRDYVYIPLGGNRHGRLHVNLMLTMLVGGLWHGGALTFLVWGALHGLGLVVQRICHAPLARRIARLGGNGQKAARLCCWLATFHFVTLLWVFFRADNLERAASVLARLFAFSGEGEGFLAFVPLAVLAGLVIQWQGPTCLALARKVQARLAWYWQGMGAGLAVALIMALGPDGVLPFIYFGF